MINYDHTKEINIYSSSYSLRIWELLAKSFEFFKIGFSKYSHSMSPNPRRFENGDIKAIVHSLFTRHSEFILGDLKKWREAISLL